MYNILKKLENQAVLTVKPEFVELLHQRHAVTNDKKCHIKKRESVVMSWVILENIMLLMD